MRNLLRGKSASVGSSRALSSLASLRLLRIPATDGAERPTLPAQPYAYCRGDVTTMGSHAVPYTETLRVNNIITVAYMGLIQMDSNYMTAIQCTRYAREDKAAPYTRLGEATCSDLARCRTASPAKAPERSRFSRLAPS